jgi:zinc protease
MQLIIEEGEATHTVASVLVLGAGAADDPPGKEGLAHLVEHLSFRAHAPGQPPISQQMTIRGIGFWNGRTAMDTTEYEQLGPPETLAAMVEVEAQRLRDPLQGVDETVFAVERSVVLNELRARDETGRFGAARDALFRQMFPPGDPYAHGTGGTRDSVSRLTLEDARAWVRTHHRPDRVTWVIAGEVDRTELTRALAQSIPPELTNVAPPATGQALPRCQPGAPPPSATPRLLAPVPTRTVEVAWSLPPAQGRLEPIIEGVQAQLLGSMNLRAGEIWGFTPGNAVVEKLDGCSLIVASFEVKDGHRPEKVLEDFLGQLDHFWPNVWYQPGTAAYKRFTAVRIELLEERVRAIEPLLQRSRARALRTRLTGSPQILAQMGDAVAQADYTQILEMGRSHLTRERARAVILDPAPLGQLGTELDSEGAGPESLVPESVHGQYTRDAVQRFVRGPGLEALQSFRATNGLEVLVVPRGQTDVVTVTLAVPEGRGTAPRSGTTEMVRLAYYRTTAGLGAQQRRWWGEDTSYFQYKAAPGNLANLLDYLSRDVDLQLSPRSDPSGLKFRAESEATRFDRHFWRALYGDSPWGWHATAAQTKAVPISEVNRWLERAFDPRKAVLVVAGDVRGDVRAEVEKWLHAWKGPGDAPARPAPLPAPPLPWERLHLLKEPYPAATQTRLRFACRLQGSSLAEELGAELLALELRNALWALGREALGGSYGFSSSVSTHRDGTMHVLINGRVGNRQVQAVAAAVQQAWSGLPSVAESEAKLDQLRWEFGRLYNVQFDTGAAIASVLATERLRGRAPTVLDDIPVALMSLTPKQMSGLGRQCKASALLGLLGEPTTLDVDGALPGVLPVVVLDSAEVKPR